MSVYIEAIVPYDFRDISDKEKALAEIYSIRDKFVAFYKLSKLYEIDICDYEDGKCDSTYELDLTLQPLSIELGNGFLFIHGGWRYSQYFYLSEDGVPWLRCMFYDVLHVLGIEEAYIVDEFHGDNNSYADGKYFRDYAMTFEDWKNAYPTPSELPMSVLHRIDAEEWPEIDCMYLDKFSDIKQRLSDLERKFTELEILTTCNIIGKYVYALEAGMPVLVDENSGKILRFGKIDGIYNDFNTAGIEVFKGNKSAFFTDNGKKVTPYRVGRFRWRWGDVSPQRAVEKIEVYNEKTKEVIYRK